MIHFDTIQTKYNMNNNQIYHQNVSYVHTYRGFGIACARRPIQSRCISYYTECNLSS